MTNTIIYLLTAIVSLLTVTSVILAADVVNLRKRVKKLEDLSKEDLEKVLEAIPPQDYGWRCNNCFQLNQGMGGCRHCDNNACFNRRKYE